LQLQQCIDLPLHAGSNGSGVATRFRALECQFTRLLGTISTKACIAAQLTTDRGLVASKQFGYLRDGVQGFHEAVNLISFNLAEVFVIHRATSTYKSASLEC
jgi:hypothetical protein